MPYSSGSADSMTADLLPLPPHPANTIVIGGGLAGLSATIEAYRAGAHVVVLDKEKNLGGNSAKATSGMNAAGTAAQAARDIHDSVHDFADDTLKSGGGRSDPLLVHTLTANSKDAHAFLESFGITLDNVSQCGGHSRPRTHRESPRQDGKPAPVGWDIVKALRAYVDAERDRKSDPAFGTITVLTRAALTELIYEDGHVRGIRGVLDGMPLELRADAVVLATGGFSADHDLLAEFAPQMLRMPTTNGPWASGDAIKIARKLGVWLADMDQVQLHPTGFIDPAHPDAPTKFLAPEALRGHGGILLAQGSGDRFTNELSTRAAVTADILKRSKFPAEEEVAEDSTADGDVVTPLPRAGAFLVLNQRAVDLFDPAVIGFYRSRGFFTEVRGAAELAALLNAGFAGMVAADATAESVTATLEAYNAAAQGAADDVHLKSVFPVIFDPENDTFVVCGITPAIHYTMGGIRINAVAEVLRPSSAAADALTVGPEGVPIPGLFAAGEVSAGVHGQNRLAGNSLLECVVFGRIAGQRAAAVTQHAAMPALVKDAFTPLRLRSVTALGQYVKLFRFDLPSARHTTGMGIGEYVAVRAELNGEQLVRYYSPISRPDDPGHIDLLIKVDDAGAMSKHIDSLRPGVDALEFKGPLGTSFPKLHLRHRNPELDGDAHQPPSSSSSSGLGATASPVKRIALIAGGTGISPMVQIIRSVLHHQREDLDVKLLYGAVADSELVYREILEQKAREHPNIKLFFTVDHPSDSWPAAGEDPMYGTGYMSADVLKRELPEPGSDLKIIICGPWKMCQILKQVLPEIGYPPEMWYSFM
ncbi:hypothetical protein H9P43_008808 [Blastocladiella emersonii ATCC 22665]|nr:hypothetical protein H9P43_008808 [Blastocladiella emersonii ATCC 22665]